MSVDIVLTTVNARYYHASFGLRYLYANLGVLRSRAALREFTLEQRAADIVEQILADHPAIVGIGVYIWNVDLSHDVVALLKQVSPQTRVVLGGPEVGFEADAPAITALADYVIGGQGDLAFADLCRSILAGSPPATGFIQAQPPPLDQLAWPYDGYTDEDIAHRLIYVEASRGCPFQCEFCLSALDQTAWPFDLEGFLQQMDGLYQRGVRHFKFVDRTFNLKTASTVAILDFFLGKDDPTLFLHFELIPDRLPQSLKQYLVRFGSGTLQFEIGVQSFNPDVQSIISRKQNNGKTVSNIQWITANTRAHIHADLIFGLPGEDMESFAAGFNRLYGLGVDEIQLGILKRLRGTPIRRHEKNFQLRFNPAAPYEIVSNSEIDFSATQRMQRFARYWDMVANSGRFANTMLLLDAQQVFQQFGQLADWLYVTTGKTHKIALNRLFDLLYAAFPALFDSDPGLVRRALEADFRVGGFKGSPQFMLPVDARRSQQATHTGASNHSNRQQRHGKSQGVS